MVLKKLREVVNTDVPRSQFTYPILEKVWKMSMVRRAAVQDLTQLVKYGIKTPKLCERVYVDIRKVNLWLPPNGDWWRESGRVLGGDWENGIESLETNRTLTYSKMHWQEGQDWLSIRETLLKEGSAGVAEFAVLESLGSSSETKRSVAKARLESYEKLYLELAANKKFKSRAELPVPHFREHGGILIHFDSKGRLIFGARGNHRFAIAKLLDLDRVPVMVGLVHPDIESNWRDLTVTS
ncbi:MAG: hypothetical protein NWR40_04410 [Ilumatobacteraceae bacterium]|nr:hypothetical protein [Ilumatobacteraceae bacterium]